MDFKYEITTERATTKEVVRAICSCILFHRLFGPVTPISREAVGVSYPCVASTAIDTLIEEKASSLLSSDTSSTQVLALQFFEKQNDTQNTGKHQRQKSGLWFVMGGGGEKEKQVCWEQWVLKVSVLDAKNDADREKMRKTTANQLLEILKSIVSTASSNKDHIPPITTTDATPFPYKLVVGKDPNLLEKHEEPSHNNKDETWGGMFKKMLE